VSDAALNSGNAGAVPASVTDAADRVGEQIELKTPVFDIGLSVEGRPIVAERVGAAGGRKVLVIGAIHGNEDAGLQIVDELRQRAIDASVELWLIESMNPDGVARQDRHNSNEVDLNRNFPYKWGPIGAAGNSQYAGTGPASEPETQAIVQFITLLRPDIAIWYHQDANLIIPSTGRDGRVRARYAEITALELADCCGGGGVYTGIAATWARNELKKDSDAVPFIVELPGGELSAAQVNAHATAVLTIAIEG
jgi:protein MpaA